MCVYLERNLDTVFFIVIPSKIITGRVLLVVWYLIASVAMEYALISYYVSALTHYAYFFNELIDKKTTYGDRFGDQNGNTNIRIAKNRSNFFLPFILVIFQQIIKNC